MRMSGRVQVTSDVFGIGRPACMVATRCPARGEERRGEERRRERPSAAAPASVAPRADVKLGAWTALCTREFGASAGRSGSCVVRAVWLTPNVCGGVVGRGGGGEGEGGKGDQARLAPVRTGLKTAGCCCELQILGAFTPSNVPSRAGPGRQGRSLRRYRCFPDEGASMRSRTGAVVCFASRGASSCRASCNTVGAGVVPS